MARDTNRLRRVSSACLTPSFVLFLGLFMALSCAGGTGSARFNFRATASGVEVPGEHYQFTNDLGWTITLHQAEITFGPVYLNTIAPLNEPSGQWWQRWSPIRTAWAHGNDHLGEGRIVYFTGSRFEGPQSFENCTLAGNAVPLLNLETVERGNRR